MALVLVESRGRPNIGPHNRAGYDLESMLANVSIAETEQDVEYGGRDKVPQDLRDGFAHLRRALGLLYEQEPKIDTFNRAESDIQDILTIIHLAELQEKLEYGGWDNIPHKVKDDLARLRRSFGLRYEPGPYGGWFLPSGADLL